MKKILTVLIILFVSLSFGQSKISYCDSIFTERNGFTGVVTKSFYGNSVGLAKTNSSVFVSVYVYEKIHSKGGTGMVITFKNGAKITHKTDKVENGYTTDVNRPYLYSVFFEATEKEIKLFKTQQIISVKLGSYEHKVTDGLILKEVSKCLLKK